MHTSVSEYDKVKMNGNNSNHLGSDESDATTHENIFLFWPNIIGTLLSSSHPIHASFC